MVQRRRAWLRRFGKAAHSPPAALPTRQSVRKRYGDDEDTSIKALIIADRLIPRKTLHFTSLLRANERNFAASKIARLMFRSISLALAAAFLPAAAFPLDHPPPKKIAVADGIVLFVTAP